MRGFCFAAGRPGWDHQPQNMADRTFPALVGFARALRWVCVLSTCLFLLFPSVAGADDVDTLFKDGSEALGKSDYQTAYDKLSKAWATRRSVDIAANLSVAERRLGKNRDAAEHIAFVVANFPPSGDPDVKTSLEATLAELKKGLAEVTVHTAQGASVRVGDKVVGLAPLPLPVYLDPGRHTFTAEKGSLKGRVTIEVAEGTTEKVAIEVVGTKAAPTTAAPEEPAPSRPVWGAAIIGSIGGAALAAGVGLTVAAQLEDAEADRIAEEDCSPVTEACVADGQSKLDNWALFHNVSFAMYGVAGAAALGLGLYLGLPEDQQPPTDAVVVPWLGPGVAGASVSGSF